MSAIAGIVHFNKEPVPAEQGAAIMDVLQKYPADNVQTWRNEDGTVFFGCHAQWITPESIDETLPYYDTERQLAITADAIIDNRDELFEALQVDYGRRKGMPDSQLILLAYAKWGEDTPKHLIGDFAFMIWDEREQKLFGARDFSGTRSLYYSSADHRFAFCTVLNPLLTVPYVSDALQEQWIAEYLAIPSVMDSADGSITVYKDILQIPPSHTIKVQGKSITLARYFQFTREEPLRLKTNKEYEEAFLDVFRTAITARLRTHRKVGALLSGGLDSGSVVSIAARELVKEQKQLHSFSYVPLEDFEDWTPKNLIPNEKPYIQRTVSYVGNIADHYLDFQGRSPYSEIDSCLDLMEMPYKIFENSFWTNGIHEAAQQKGIGMLLTGARGNLTISWGWALSFYANQLKRMQWIRLYREMQLYCRNVGAGRKKFLKAVLQKAYPTFVRGTEQAAKSFPSIINPSLAQITGVYRKLQDHGIDTTGFSFPKDIYEARRKHFESTNAWNLNGVSGTRKSLRYHLWNRDPTNDVRVIRFCLSVPEEQFVLDGMDRALIRRATEGLLPDEIRLNQRVRGIQGADVMQRMAPVWDQFLDESKKMCSDADIAGYIHVPVLREAIDAISGDQRPVSHYDKNFSIVMRSLILYRFLKRSPLKGGDSSAQTMAEAGVGST